MAVITQEYINAIHQYEGGSTGALTDPAHLHPSPCGNDKSGHPIHTVKGVTYSSFLELAPKLGYTADCATFLAMPDDVWIKIFKEGYWNPIQLDNINSNGVAYLLADSSWGSGKGYVPPFLKKFLANNYNITATDTTSQNNALNDLAAKDEAGLIKKLADARLASMQTMKDKQGNSLWTTYGSGWTSRVRGLESLASSMVGKAKEEVKGVLKEELSAGAYKNVASAYHFTRKNILPISLISLGVIGLTITTILLMRKKPLALN